MNQTDFLRPVVLPGLLAMHIAGQLPAGTHPRHAAALLDAAEVGYCTTTVGPTTKLVPKFWYVWCQENRHPPVVRHLRLKWATIEASLYLVGVGVGKSGLHTLRRELLRFQERKGGRLLTYRNGIHLRSTTLLGSVDAARAMVDLLHDHLDWRKGTT